jgi:hypothetical protein
MAKVTLGSFQSSHLATFCFLGGPRVTASLTLTLAHRDLRFVAAKSVHHALRCRCRFRYSRITLAMVVAA